MTQIPTTEQFARAEIDALIAKYSATELRLTNQLASAYNTGIDRGIEMPQQEFAKRARDRAEQILDGSEIDEALPVADQKGPPKKKKLSDLILPPAQKDQAGPGAVRLHLEREAVRIILRALNHQRIEAEAAAALKRAEALEPEYKRIRRDWTLALARLTATGDRLDAFREAAGPARAARRSRR